MAYTAKRALNGNACGRRDNMRIGEKLKSHNGFTLAETLLAVLILLLVSVIVANGIPAASNAYRKTVLAANAQSLMSTTVAALRDELGTAWDVSVADNKVTYYSADTGNRSTLEKADDGAIKLTEYVSTDNLNMDASSVGKIRELTPSATLTKDLMITYTSVTYTYDSTAAYGIIVFTGLKVTPKGKTDPVIAQMETPLTIRIITAKPTVTPSGS